MKKILCVISHTHWDREWYKPYEVFRLKLVDLIDRLLKIIDKYPDYIFHLDAQTIVLEDYLEIHPSKRENLKKHISNGNIIVGPWYLQNDFYLTSGESTVRNLIIGQHIAEEFGKSAKVGYAPDQFGNVSQLPQILSDFGIDSFVFARGFSEYDKDENGKLYRRHAPLEFIWEGADTSRVTAFYMRGWYNNAQRIPTDTDKTKKMVDSVMEDFHDKAATEYILLMNGVDHLEAQDDLPVTIDNFNAEFGDEFTMKQYSLEDYIADVKKSVSDNGIALSVHKGELRKGSIGDILPGTLSSRHYIKVANVRMQNMLEQRLEPLYSMLELNGMNGIYSADHFRYMWKKLVQNHPHDTICGCSTDAVHRHSYDNLERLQEFAEDMLQRGLYELAYHTDAVQNATDHCHVITAVNTTSFAQSGVIPVTVDIPADDNINGFYIVDTYGNEIPFCISSKEQLHRDVTSPLNLPGSILVDRYGIYLDAGEVKPYSQKCFKIIPGKCFEPVDNRNEKVLENEFIKVCVNDSGRIDITFKESGEYLEDAIYLEDMGDRGSSYNFISADEKAITSREFIPTVEVLENNDLCGRIKLTWNMELSEHFDFETFKRSKITDITTVSLILELYRSDRMLKINYEINNRCRDHRLRLVTVIGPKTSCFADIPFDIVERNDTFFEPDPPSQTFPNTSFVALEENGVGTAVLTEGAHEAERIGNDGIALTLLRATGVIERGEDHGPIGGEMWVAEENQCIRTLNGRLALAGYKDRSSLPCLSTLFRTPVCSICVPTDRRVFSGGRPAVQGSAYSELYYLSDPWDTACIKENTPAIEVTGESIAVSALKLAEDEKGMVIRFYNYSDKPTVATVKANGDIYRSDMAEHSRSLLGKDKVEINLAAKKIVTLYTKNRI